MERFRNERRPVAVVFDMDGLILDTEPLAARAWSEAASALGVEFDEALALAMVGRTFSDCGAMVRARYDASYPVDALLGRWHAAFDAIAAREGVAVKPGVHELVEWLDLHDIRRAVATSTRRERARMRLEDAALLARFDDVVGGDEVAHGKPAPDIYLEVARRLGRMPCECVVLEDSEPGVRAAFAAGASPIMVPDLNAPSSEILALRPRVMASLHEVRAHFASLPA